MKDVPVGAIPAQEPLRSSSKLTMGAAPITWETLWPTASPDDGGGIMSVSERLPSFRRVLRWASAVAFGLLCCVVAAIIVILTVLPRMTGGAALTVLTGSMTPEIAVGSVVLIRPVDPQHPGGRGTSATYQVSPSREALVTHRVIDVQGFGGRASSSSRATPTAALTALRCRRRAVRGEVWFHVPYLGSIRDAVHAEGMFALAAAVLLAGYALAQLGGGLKDRRRGAYGAQKRAVTIGASAVIAQPQTPTGEAPADLARRWGRCCSTRTRTR